jgi:biopolymer transport protein ExbB
MTRQLSAVVITLLFQASVFAQTAEESNTTEPVSLDQLVEQVRAGTTERRSELAAREQRFAEVRDDRARMLREIEAERRAAEAEADRLRAEFEAGEQDLSDLETQLEENAGDLREVFNVARQSAGDVVPTLENSLVRAEHPLQDDLLATLSSGETTPTSSQLRELWLMLLEEMNESGKISRFATTVIGADGNESDRTVTRIGTFAAVADGDYLRFLPESSSLLVLPRQPKGIDTGTVRAFETAEDPIAPIAVDPSRGAILALVVQAPDLRERINQGGIIGYIILGLGLIGLILAVERLFSSWRAKRAMDSALANANGDGTANPQSGHVIDELRRATLDPELVRDADALSAKFDEIVMISAERMRRGLPALAIFAAVSPLLGLLGTVTGMIETFQVITLFGAGDPRLMSGGISQALITTQLGLSVAIPLLLAHSFVQSRINGLIAILDETAAELFATSRSTAEAA